MNILITGGAGFIGSHLSQALLDKGHVITVVDNFNSYYNPDIKRSNIKTCLQNNRYNLIKADIRDYPTLKTKLATRPFDVFIHLAARAGVRPSIEKPLLYEQVNVQGTTHLLELARECGVKKFIFASSSSVYGANRKTPFHEQDFVDNPVSPYAATKKAGELLCYTYHSLYDISVNCLRFFTVYGPRQRPDMAIHKFTRLIDQGEPVPVFGNGDSRRDYTFIDDIIQGIIGAIDHCDGYNIYNLGESKTVPLLAMIGLVEKALDRKANLTFLPAQKGDVPITFADISKARQDLGYAPQVSIEDGIEQFVNWYTDHRSDVKKVKI
ncbi:MAG: GDP-mannose 4,6-dehydratase [candidate division KSB1 bacterium]|nr:GDP-mannose 4,6-dehydratase [candidate division KSB1 bacterium]